MLNRIFLSADIEGTCGIAHWDETELNKPDYEPFRRQMTREVAAACEGALAAEMCIRDRAIRRTTRTISSYVSTSSCARALTPPSGMQYTQRRLQRSVMEMRR